MKTTIVLVVLCVAVAASLGEAVEDDVLLKKDKANNFSSRRINKRNLYEECYVEECSYEEVHETYGGIEFGHEYYNAYTCKKKGLNCKDPDCGSGSEPEGSYSLRCRDSCRQGENHISMYDNKCSSEKKCCMCHSRNLSCAVDL